MDLPYRFQLDLPSRREAADPTMVVFQGQYWLFASKSGGYWHSKDLLHWEFIAGSGYPVEGYAPTVVAMNGKLYLTANETQQLFSTDEPATGKWYPVANLGHDYRDPALFLDDDGRLYMYHGLANDAPLHVTELDPKDGFKPLQTVNVEASRDPQHRGWEIRGDHNEALKEQPWIEGSWMNKHAGKYYLQYAAPGTEFKSYGDGVLVGDSPMGPFQYAPYSPFSYKPTGFIAGAGHSSTFQDLDGDWWHIATMSVSVRHVFERRLGLFPTFFLPDGQLVADTYLGDYPHWIGGDRGLAGWMLLSYNKPTSASSTLTGHETEKAVDENIRTWWSAKSASAGEWLQLDLGSKKRINAVQINFADEGSTALGRIEDGYRYAVAVSKDNRKWRTIIDRQTDGRDSPQDYEPLPKAVKGRYVRITNFHTPAGALFSISGFRIFGKGKGKGPASVRGIRAVRDPNEPRHARVEWDPSDRAGFYIVRFGIAPDRLFESYQVYDGTEVDVPSLNAGVKYYVAVDAVNEKGIVRGKETVVLP
jgi:xylan 1,4-beta-xylosidase